MPETRGQFHSHASLSEGQERMTARSVKSAGFFQLVPKTWGRPTVFLIVKFKRIKYIHKILKECLSQIYSSLSEFHGFTDRISTSSLTELKN